MPNTPNGILVTKFAKFVLHYSASFQVHFLRRIKKGAHRLPSYPTSNITNQTKREWKKTGTKRGNKVN